MREVLRHNGINGWDECRARRRPCPLGGVHVGETVADKLNSINVDLNKNKKEALKKEQTQIDNEVLFGKLQQAEKLKNFINTTDDFISASVKTRSLAHEQQYIDEYKKKYGIPATVGNDILLHDLSNGRPVLKTESLNTTAEALERKERLQHVDRFNSRFVLRGHDVDGGVINRPWHLKEFFNGDPSMGNIFKGKNVGDNVVDTYNKAVRELYVQQKMSKDFDPKDNADTVETVKFLRKQLLKVAVTNHKQKALSIKNGENLDILDDGQAKQVNREHRRQLKHFFAQLNGSSWDTRIL